MHSSHQKTDFSHTRIIGLDLLRASSILFVLLSHGGGFLLRTHHQLLTPVLFLGVIGVEIFFILSGYLIGTIIINSFKDSFTVNKAYHFLLRRWFRTIPNYVLFLGLNILFFYFLNRTRNQTFPIFQTVVSHITFTQNFFDYKNPTFFPESWSLAIEEWFYLTITMLIGAFNLKLKRNISKSILDSCIILIALPFCLRIYYTHTYDISWIQASRTTILHLDSILWGVLLSMLYTRYATHITQYREYIAFIGTLLLLYCSQILCETLTQNTQDHSFFSKIFLNPLISVSLVLLVPYVKEVKINSSLFSKAITATSLYSYSLYLCNLLVFHMVDTFIHVHYIIQFILFFTICFFVSFLTYTYFEMPITKLRERFSGKNW